MTNPTPEQQAVALAEKHFGSYAHEARSIFIAMLAERDKQHTEELAQQSGVMPWVVEFDNEHYPKVCDPDEVSEAIATLQAQLNTARLERDMHARYRMEAELQVAELEQTRRKVLEWERKCDQLLMHCPDMACALCGEERPHTGTCGGGEENPRALCYRYPPLQADACKAIEELGSSTRLADAYLMVFQENHELKRKLALQADACLAESQKRMLHDFPALQQFHAKHALGPMRPPSCLCCGQQTHPITRPVAVKHMELPGVVICEKCYTAAQADACKVPQWVELTDEDRERAFKSMPDMLDGFLKTWGWLHFAKAIEKICKEKNIPLSASPAAPTQVETQWRTIETAPPEDTPIWLYEDGRIWIGTYIYEGEGWMFTNCYGSQFWDGSKWDCSDAELDDDYRPTHWMPLPSAPSQGEGK